MSSTMVMKKENLSAFTIPCSIVVHKFEKLFCDISESINRMPFAVFQKLGLSTPKTNHNEVLNVRSFYKKSSGSAT